MAGTTLSGLRQKPHSFDMGKPSEKGLLRITMSLTNCGEEAELTSYYVEVRARMILL